MGARVAAPSPVAGKDRQLAVLAAHIATTTRRWVNAQWWGQATVAKAEAVQGQTTINQKVTQNVQNITRSM